MPIKILLISENAPSPIGGIERHCFNIINLFHGDENIRMDFISKEKIKHVFLKGINKIYFDPNDLEHKIREISPDIVHIHGFASLAVCQAINISCKLNKKIIYSPHCHPFNTLDNPFLGKCFFYAFLAGKLKKTDAVITINRNDTCFFSKYSDGVYMMPHWLDEEMPKKTNVVDKKMILFIGRVEPNKGIDHLYSLPQNKYSIHCVSSGNFKRDDFVVHRNIGEKKLYENCIPWHPFWLYRPDMKHFRM